MLVSSPTLDMSKKSPGKFRSDHLRWTTQQWVSNLPLQPSRNAILYPVLHAWARDISKTKRFTGSNILQLMQNWQIIYHSMVQHVTPASILIAAHEVMQHYWQTWRMKRMFHTATLCWSKRPMLPTKTSPVWMPQRMEILSSDNKSPVSPHTVLEIVTSQRWYQKLIKTCVQVTLASSCELTIDWFQSLLQASLPGGVPCNFSNKWQRWKP